MNKRDSLFSLAKVRLSPSIKSLLTAKCGPGCAARLVAGRRFRQNLFVLVRKHKEISVFQCDFVTVNDCGVKERSGTCLKLLFCSCAIVQLNIEIFLDRLFSSTM